ncbi:transcriptional repressor [Gordonia phage Syleon]|uniref:Immunity repressor n=1 Tax=Gordonia phage Syleon TaxID=2653718 RepID=A0A5Q2WBC6_9CAUD|nr:transcriptional repressor [Gordonia phage Syleon]QGH75771.1 immunity repressor [Gordonia phage Syleon]
MSENPDLLCGLPCSKLGFMRKKRRMSVEAYAHYKLDRRVTVGEAAEAVGLGRSQYTVHRDNGTISADQVMRAMNHFGLNPFEALVEMGYGKKSALREAVDLLDSEDDDFSPHSTTGRGTTATRKRTDAAVEHGYQL